MAVKREITLLDPIFTIPEGAEDEFEYSKDRLDDEFIDIDENANQSVDVIVEVISLELFPPENLVIISQTLRRDSSGRAVVDVVLETDTIPGADKYEIKVTTL